MITLLEALVVTIGISSLLVQVVYKYGLDSVYDNLIKPSWLPDQFCLMCFATQTSLIISSLLVLIVGLQMYSIILLTLSSPVFVILLTRSIDK